MKKINIFFNYKHTDKPWGGTNNFNRIMYDKFLLGNVFEMDDNFSSKTDIVFMNSMGKGPINNSKRTSYLEFKKYKMSNAKIVVRAVNLHQHAHKHNIRLAWLDFWTIKILNESDFVIFQSEYQRTFFLGAGFNNPNNLVVHNGADNNLFKFINRKLNNNVLKLVSTVAGARPTKNLKLLSELSLLNNIKIYHIGVWDKKIDSKNIIFLGRKTHAEMSVLYESFDAFVHLAIKDPCPNSIFEAILSGLPVIYYPTQTSGLEIVKNNGLSINLDNYEKTFNELKINYIDYINSIKLSRDYYGIDRALSRYIEVFKKVLNEK